MDRKELLASLGFSAEPPPADEGKLFVPAVRTGNLVYTSGQAPELDGEFIIGRVGADLSIERAVEAARWCAANALRAVMATGVDLDDVVRVVKVLGMVNAPSDLAELPRIIDGASQLLLEVLGPDAGAHARSAVGMQLPFGLAVELELIVEVR